MISPLRKERRNDFKSQVVHVSDAKGATLDDSNFVVEALHETEGNFMIRLAVADDAVPMTFNQSNKVFEWFHPAPTQLAFPVAEKFTGPRGIVVIPQLPK